MARLSGLASQHHPEGPGDAPRRKRGRKSKNESVDMTEGSTAGSKRAASPASPTVEVHTKRTKRVIIDDHDQLSREVEESVTRSQISDTIEVARPTSSRSGPSHRRRHSEPLVAVQDDDEEGVTGNTPPPLPATQPVPGLTPHLERLGAPIRPTKSSRRARMSMPAQLHVTEVDETDGMREVQFAPLSAVLDNRVRRRLRRNHLGEEMNEIEDHKKEDAKLRKAYTDLRRQLREKENLVGDLEYQLEVSRMGNIDISEDRTAELHQQLEDAKKQIDDLRASSIYTPNSRETSEFAPNGFDDDDDGLMLVDPDELNISQEDMQAEPTANGFYATRALASSQVTMESLTSMSQTTKDILAQASQPESTVLPDKISDQAVERYESEIKDYARRLGELEGALRVVTLELQNLHILPAGAHIEHILTQLRHVLEDSRQKYEELFPNSTAAPTNVEFLRQIMEDLEGINQELLEKTILVEKKNQRVQLLQTQYESTIDMLSGAEEENTKLNEEKARLESEIERVNQGWADTEDELNKLQTAQTEMQAVMVEKEATINGQRDELEDKDTDLERIRAACDSYRAEVDTLTTTITRLEQDFTDRIAQMEEEHAAVVQDLESQLENQTEGRLIAEADAQQRGDFIDELEAKIEDMDQQFDEYRTKVNQLQQLLTEETTARETTEAKREELADELYGKTNDLENLNETLDDLENQLAEFRTNLETERTQRQQTEADLDGANGEIDKLTSQLHDAGIQANELRTKLWQAQQQREQDVAQLEDEANTRIKELENSLEIETQNRTNADNDVASLQEQVAQLEQDITTTETALTEMTTTRDTLQADRDEQVTNLNRQYDDLKQKYAGLENTTNSTIDSLQATITDLTNDVTSLQTTVEQLEESATQNAESHADELADRDATIDKLSTSLSTARDENANLAKENKSLAARVEDEANELLNIMGAHAEESNALRAVIATQDSHIADLKAQALTSAAAHAEELAALDQQIEELTIIGEARGSHVVELEAQVEELKERFRVQAEDLKNTLDQLVETNRENVKRQEEVAEATKDRAMSALREVSEMKVKGVNVKHVGVDLKKVVSGKVTKVSKKKGAKGARVNGGVGKVKAGSYRDSGIGVEEDDEGLEEGVVVVE